MKRKWLSMLLALALVFSLAPAMALAEEKTVTDAAGLKDAIENQDVPKIIVSGDITLDDNTSFVITRPITIVGQDGSTPTITVNCSEDQNFALIDFQDGSAGSVLQNINFVLNTSTGRTKRAYIVRFNNYTNTASAITISNVDFSSENAPASGILGMGATGGSTGGNIQVSNCTFNNFSYAVYLDNISNFTFSNNKVSNTMYNAINVGENGGSNITITNNTFTNISTEGYDAEMYSSGIRVSENVAGNSEIKISNNTIQMAKGMLPLSVDSAASTHTTITDLTWEADADSPITSAVINALPEGTTIKLTEDVQLDAMLDIQQDDITLDLGEHTITASESFPTVESGGYTNDKHLINVSGKNVTIKNGTLQTTASNKHALNVYQTTGAVIENLTIDHSVSLGGAPIIVNASELTVKGSLSMTLGEKSWYGINVDPKEANASLTFEAGSQVTMTGKDEDVVRLDGDSTKIAIANAEDAGLAKDEDGNYILAQNPEVQPPTPPTSEGGSDDTLWPNILQHPQSVSAPAGSLATFSVVANGGPLSYQWQVDRRDGKGFVSIPGATGATLTVGPVTGAENGYQYRCAVTLYGATMYSGAGQLFVTAGMIPKTGDMPGSPALLLALAGLGLAAWVVARRRAG